MAHSTDRGRPTAVIEPTPAVPRSGRLLLGGAGVLAVALIALLILALRGPGADSIHALGSLPDRLTTCGRSWDGHGPVQGMAEIRELGFEPVIVDTAPLAPCPAGMYPASGGMATVVYVRVAEDGYVEYSLLGGP